MEGIAGPAVSVIVPTRDRVGFLQRAVESVLAQTCHDLEVVVVVDGPYTETAALVAQHDDPRVRLVQRDASGGAAAARNAGIEAARGRYLGFLDDDDLWLPTKLERQLPLLEAGAYVVHSLVYVADGDGTVYDAPSKRGFRLFREVAAAGYPYVWLLRRSSYHISTFLIRREAVEAVGGFDPELVLVEDLAFVHALWRRYEFQFVDEPLSKYCFHGGNSVLTNVAGTWGRFAESELAWIAETAPPGHAAAEAYLRMQIAQAAWIGGDYRSTVRPALQAHRLDPSAVTGKRIAKYMAAVALPRWLVDAARRRTRRLRETFEPDPWLDLPTPLPIDAASLSEPAAEIATDVVPSV